MTDATIAALEEAFLSAAVASEAADRRAARARHDHLSAYHQGQAEAYRAALVILAAAVREDA